MAWRALRHPNILPLMGVVASDTEFAMVSEWMTNGNINQFVEGHQDVNRFELVGSLSNLLESTPVADGSQLCGTHS